jgi:small acid-soluble spore protein O (minor)
VIVRLFFHQRGKTNTVGGDFLSRKKSNHVIPGMNAAQGQGKGAGYNEELANEPLTVREKMNNKKRKKNQ